MLLLKRSNGRMEVVCALGVRSEKLEVWLFRVSRRGYRPGESLRYLWVVLGYYNGLHALLVFDEGRFLSSLTGAYVQ
jgi:hypothetical protein